MSGSAPRGAGRGRIISFAWTTPALLAGRKTVTRRDWVPKYARSFRAGEICQAYDRSPRVGGAQHIANIRLRAAPYLQNVASAPASDYEAEGLAYMEEIGVAVPSPHGDTPRAFWDAWKAGTEDLWVVRFELMALSYAGVAMLAQQIAGLGGEGTSAAGPQIGLTLPPTTGELQDQREALHG